MDPIIKPLLYCCLHGNLVDYTFWADHATHNSELFLFPLSIGKTYNFVQCLSSRGEKKCFKMKSKFGGEKAKVFAVTLLSEKPEEAAEQQDLASLLIEGKTSPYFQKFQNIYFDRSINSLITITEFFDMTLEDQLPNLSKNERLQIFINVCEGIFALHQKKFIHSNVCLRSVVLSNEKKPIIVGLINSQKMNSPNYETIYKYTYKHIWPPEFLQGKQLNEKFDVWCLGILLHQIFSEIKTTMPFMPYKTNKGLHRVLRENWKDEANADKFIKIHPSVRLINETLCEMIKSKLLNKYNFDKHLYS